MQKFSISFLGRNRSGIVANVARTMADSNCNIAQLAQVLIGGDFSATFLVEVPDSLGIEELRRRIECGLRNQFHDVSFLIREASPAQTDEDSPVTEPYVVTANGPDRPGLVAGLAHVFAAHRVSIESLKFVSRQDGGDALVSFEILVPKDVDAGRLRREIQSKGKELRLTVAMQHRRIFEAMHRISEN